MSGKDLLVGAGPPKGPPAPTSAAPTARRRGFTGDVGEVLGAALAADDRRRAERLDATEAQCQATIVEAARRSGWRVFSVRSALNRRGKWGTPIQGDAGYPDLTLVHPRAERVMWVELKRRPNRLEAAQVEWSDALVRARCDWRLVYVPDELDAFCQELADIGMGVAR